MFVCPLKTIFLWVKLGGIERVVFSLHGGNELQSLCVCVYREKLPKLLHLKPEGNFTRELQVPIIKLLLSEILPRETPVVKVDSYWQSSQIVKNITRCLTTDKK